MLKTKKTLPPRDDIILFNAAVHQEQFDRNIRWGNCPDEFIPRITKIITDHWDAFAEEGLQRNIRGFQCRIDTGNITPISCKKPRYGPHESLVMNKLIEELETKGLIEDDDGPWGALIVLAAKAGQDVPWYDYIWRMCVSYRKLNQVTRPFLFPVPRCDDAVQCINPRFKYFIIFP